MLRRVLRAGCTALALSLPAVTASADAIDEAALRELVLQTIRENPEIIREAIGILQEREAEAEAARAKQALAEQGDALFGGDDAAILGNPEGDFTVVEFFDYNCGYCRRAHADVMALLEVDPNVRLVMREWPILGEESVVAARASLAARAQGMFEEFHNAMMTHEGRATDAVVRQIASEIGMDVDEMEIFMASSDADAHFARSQSLSQALGINGTPAFVFGERLVPGLVTLEQMQEMIAEARG